MKLNETSLSYTDTFTLSYKRLNFLSDEKSSEGHFLGVGVLTPWTKHEVKFYFYDFFKSGQSPDSKGEYKQIFPNLTSVHVEKMIQSFYTLDEHGAFPPVDVT